MRVGVRRIGLPPPLLRPVPRRGYNAIHVVHLRGTRPTASASAIEMLHDIALYKFNIHIHIHIHIQLAAPEKLRNSHSAREIDTDRQTDRHRHTDRQTYEARRNMPSAI